MLWLKDCIGGGEGDEGWYVLKTEHFLNNGLRTLLRIYGSSTQLCLFSVFPSLRLKLKSWLFAAVPNGFWLDESNIREAIEWLCEKLNFKEFNDKYKLTGKDFRENKLNGLLHNYHGSFIELLRAVYPLYSWDLTKFIHKRHESMTYIYLKGLQDKGIIKDLSWDAENRAANTIEVLIDGEIVYLFLDFKFIHVKSKKQCWHEVDGEQHFFLVYPSDTQAKVNCRQKNDRAKNAKALEEGAILSRVAYTERCPSKNSAVLDQLITKLDNLENEPFSQFFFPPTAYTHFA